MPQNQLGLFDTPPDRNEVLLSLLLVGLLFAAFIILSALPDTRPTHNIPAPMAHPNTRGTEIMMLLSCSPPCFTHQGISNLNHKKRRYNGSLH